MSALELQENKGFTDKIPIELCIYQWFSTFHILPSTCYSAKENFVKTKLKFFKEVYFYNCVYIIIITLIINMFHLLHIMPQSATTEFPPMRDKPFEKH
jgi:hypothetical protein